jgi:Family of unknown function (DUF5335)
MAIPVKIPEGEWRRYFDAVTHEMDSADLSIEVSDGAWPPQLEVDRLALRFVAYDVRDRLFEVAGSVEAGPTSEVLHHLVADPQCVTVDRPATTPAESKSKAPTVPTP